MKKTPDLESVRQEWPASGLNPDSDLASWRSGWQVYEAYDDYQSMMRSGALMCQALRHHLYGDGILAGSDLPETVYRVLFASLTAPPDRKTLSEQARTQIRLALTVMKKHRWQPASMGGSSAMDSPIFEGGNYALLSAAIAPAETPWEGDLDAFFTAHPIDIPASGGEPDATKQLLSPSEVSAFADHVQTVIAEADAGDAASQAYRQGLAASLSGDKETALRHYEEAAQLGSLDAMFEAGCVNEQLGRVPASLFWWEKAARNGQAKSAWNLACSVLNQGDLPRARDWYQTAAELGDPRGFAALTELADRAGDAQAEMYWSQVGAEAGQPFCLMRYGQLMIQANPEDRATLLRALPLEERAAEMGEPGAMLLAGVVNADLGRMPEARRWLEQADRAGHPRARRLIDWYKL